MRWYILKVQFNREDTIRTALEKRIRLSNMESSFGEILVPTEDVVEFTRAGKRRVVKRKLYPGYLVIRMIINDDTWFLVRETNGVGDFTGSGGKPTPMTDSDVEKIIKMAYPDADDEQVPQDYDSIQIWRSSTSQGRKLPESRRRGRPDRRSQWACYRDHQYLRSQYSSRIGPLANRVSLNRQFKHGTHLVRLACAGGVGSSIQNNRVLIEY